MKKIISLFLSLLLILSAVVVSISPASYAAGGETELAKVLLDVKGASLTVTSNKIAGVISLFGNEDMSGGTYNVRSDDTLLGENVVLINRRPSYSGSGINNNDTRMQISGNNTASGKVSFKFKLYLAAESDGNLAMRIRQGSSGYAVTKSLMDLGLDCFKWYTIESFVDFGATTDNCYLAAYNSDGSLYEKQVFTCSFQNTNLGFFFLWGTPTSDVMPSGAPDELSGKNAFYAIKDFSIVHIPGLTKAKIISVASDGEAAYNQKNLSFKLSKTIEGLSKEHIIVRNKASLEEIQAVSLSAQSSGEVSVILEKDLAPWTNYELEIKEGCYGDYKEFSLGVVTDVTPIKKEFHTATAPFDMKEPAFSLDGSKLTASTTIINTSGNPEDVCLVFVSYNSEGRVKDIKINSLPLFEAAYPGSDAGIMTNVEDGDYLRLFVIDNLTNKKALFGKSWTVNHVGESIVKTVFAGKNTIPGTIALGDFDYSKKKIKIDLNSATSAATEWVISIYSQVNNPVYIDSITTASDGTYSKEILFGQDLPYGSYTVEFKNTENRESIENSFIYYTPDQILNNKRAAILREAKSAATSGALMNVILGLNENEQRVNDNFDIFLSDAGSTKYYDLKNKDEVFALMKASVSYIGNYNDLLALFKNTCDKRYELENKKTSSPSSNNKGYGSSSVVATENKGGSKDDAENNDNISVPGFADMKGHWAEKFANELSGRGIINGYADGSFKGDNSITRAELVKILCSTFAGTQRAEIDFNDVNSSEWYAEYVARALNYKMVNGYEDGSFRPNISVSREDAIVMLYRAMSLKASLPQGYTLFADDLDISSYAHEATRCLGELKIVTGDSNKKLNPQNPITRAEVAAIICRSLDYMASH